MNSLPIGTLAGEGARTAEYVQSLIPFGFESFQINLMRTIGEMETPRLAEQLRDVFGDSPTVVSCLGVYGNPLGDREEDARVRATLRNAIDHAKDFGTDLVTGFTGRVRGASIPDSIPAFREFWTEMTDYAGERGVRIAFENCAMEGNWHSGDWNIAHSPAAWKLMFEAVPAQNMGLEWEPCHQMLLLIDPLPQLREWCSKIFHVHGKDATILPDVIQSSGISSPQPFGYHRTPGFGDSNWTDIISFLRMGGYRGTIDIEGWHDPIYRADMEIPGQVHALNYLKQCRGGVEMP